MIFNFVLQRPRLFLLLLGAACFGAVGTATVLGKIFDMEVCAMCWFQRLSFLLAGGGFILAAAWPRLRIITQRLGELGLLLALESAGRQTYLLLNPEAASGSCGAGLFYYLQIEDYANFFRAGMLGGVECAENQPLFLGLHLPQWSLVAVIALLAIYAAWLFKPNIRPITQRN